MLNSSLKNARLLIVDDQESNIALLESVLDREGYTDLKSISDSRQVSALLDPVQPDLILLDLRMPHLDGFAVMEQLRERILTEDYLPILVLTADITPEAKLRALAAGARDFLTKPFDVTEVTLRIRNLLETRYLHLQQKYQNQVLEEKILARTVELRQRAEDLELIHALNAAINRGDDLHKILALMADELHRIFNCIGTMTALPNPDKQSMHIQHIELPSPLAKQIEKLAGASFSAIPLKIAMTGVGQLAQVLRAGAPKAINDADTIKAVMAEYTDNLLLKGLVSPVYEILKIDSMLMIPLIAGAEIYGLLEMARTETTTAADLRRVQVIAGQLTTAIGRRRIEEETTLKNQQLTMLNHLGQTLNKLASIPDILERTSNLIGQVFDNRNLYIALYDEATNYVSFPIYWMAGERRNFLEGRPLGSGLTEFVIRTRAPVLISDHVREALSERGVALIGSLCECYLGVPILIDERLIGVIAVQDYEHANVYNANHVELLSTIASQAAIAIENASLYETSQKELTERKRAEEALRYSEQAARRTAEQLRMVNRISVKITAGLDFEQVMQTIYEQCQRIGDTDTFYVLFYDDTTGILTFPYYFKDGERRSIAERNLKENSGLAGPIINSRQSLYLPNLSQLPAGLNPVRQPGLATQSFIGVPLLINDRVVGVLSMQSHSLDAYSPEQIQTIELLATQVAIVIQNSQLYEQIQAEKNLLQESEVRHRAVVETANDAIITIDKGGAIVDWNPAAESIFGFSLDEAIGMPTHRIIPVRMQERQRHGFEQVVASGIGQRAGRTFEAAALTKDGREFPIELSLAEWQTQEEQFFTALIRDISERKQRENELHAIATLSTALRSAPSRAEMLPVIVEQLVSLLNCETVSIEIIDPLTGDAVTEAARGIWEALIGTRQKSGAGINAIISQMRQPYFTDDLKNDPNLAYPEWTHQAIRGGIGSPLIAQDNLIGFLWVGRRNEIAKSEVRLFTAVADIAATAIHRATLYEQSQKDAVDLILAYDSTLEGWAHALELRDQETEGHTRRVMQMTVDLARRMGFEKPELENARRGALLHDIGKMGIPDSVLLKPGTLNEREWEIMRRHPEYADEFLEPIAYLHPVIDIPYCHHEKWNGSGYPRGLVGEQIPFMARIFAIVDVWDALRSDRPYRTAWSNEKTRKYIVEQSGRHFDPHVVQVFLELLKNE